MIVGEKLQEIKHCPSIVVDLKSIIGIYIFVYI